MYTSPVSTRRSYLVRYCVCWSERMRCVYGVGDWKPPGVTREEKRREIGSGLDWDLDLAVSWTNIAGFLTLTVNSCEPAQWETEAMISQRDTLVPDYDYGLDAVATLLSKAAPLDDLYLYLRDHPLQNPAKAKVHHEHGFSKLRLAVRDYLEVSSYWLSCLIYVLIPYRRNVNILSQRFFEGHFILIPLTLIICIHKVDKLSYLFSLYRS